MIDYLKKYNLTSEDIGEIKLHFNKDILSKFEIMAYNVSVILDYLQNIGVNNYKGLILERPDLCFSNISYLKEKIEKIDPNIIIYIIENDPQNLISFDI